MKIQQCRNLLILFLFLSFSALFAENEGARPTKIKTFVKKVKEAGELSASIQAADGGYVTVSYVAKVDPESRLASLLVRKINASGLRVWERRLDFQVYAGDFTVAHVDGIAQTTDGGFVLVGRVGCLMCDNHNVNGAMIIKLHPDGTIGWKKSFGESEGEGFTRFVSVTAKADGGFTVIGEVLPFTGKGTHPILIRFTSQGDILWKKSLQNALDESFYSLRSVSSNNGFILTFGIPNGAGVIKVDDSGNVLWKKSMKTPGFVFQSVGLASDDGVVLAGNCENCNKLFLIGLKANGSVNWKAKYSFSVPGLLSVSNAVQTSDGGYLVTGAVATSGEKYYGFVAKIDSSRNIVSQKTFGTAQAGGESIFAAPDGGYLLFGSSSEDMLVLKLNSEGIVPACGFFHSLSSKSLSFGRLKSDVLKIVESDALSFGPLNDFGFSSTVTNHPSLTLCQLPPPEPGRLTVTIPMRTYPNGVKDFNVYIDYIFVGTARPGSSVSKQVAVGSHFVNATTALIYGDAFYECLAATEPVMVPSGGLSVFLKNCGWGD